MATLAEGRCDLKFEINHKQIDKTCIDNSMVKSIKQPQQLEV